MQSKSDDNILILVLAGTTREGRESFKAAEYVAEIGKTYKGLTIELVDPKNFNFPGDGDDAQAKDPAYTELTAKADGFFIVTPEYNHSIPGSLKRMIDSEADNYKLKPVALAGASSGAWGGARAVETLVIVVRAVGLVVTQTSAYFPRVQDAFDAAGNPKDERTEKSVRKLYDELIWMARLLKAGRAEIKSDTDK